MKYDSSKSKFNEDTQFFSKLQSTQRNSQDEHWVDIEVSFSLSSKLIQVW